MGIFKKSISHSKGSNLDKKLKLLESELKKTDVTVSESDRNFLHEQKNNSQEVEKYNWRDDSSNNTDVLDLKEEVSAIKESKKTNTSLKNVRGYNNSVEEELSILRKQIFDEISENFLFNIPSIEKKIDKVLGIYDSLQEGLLNLPPETVTPDPLTPLNQNFVTVEDLNKHYNLFINRIQEQIATVGGGGETKLKYLDDVVGIATNASAYDGKYLKYDHTLGKFVFETVIGGGGGGTQGTQGVQGLQGTDGTNGTNGTQGTQGIQGIGGSQGVQGIQGSASTVQGTQGIQGTLGAQGTTGNFGGVTFDFTFDTDTTDTDPGVGRLKLNNASVGIATELYIDDQDDNTFDIQEYLRGIDDSTSAIKGHFKITNKSNASDFALFVITGSSVEATGYFKVPCGISTSSAASFSNNEDVTITFARTGDKGDSGTQGTQGIQGITGSGAQGTTGTQGSTGTQGIQGPQGRQGIQGVQGYGGTQGNQGRQGVQGVQGITGAGTQGSQGVQGELGTQGSAGANGFQGTTGDQGIQGIQGVQGGQGVQGNDGAATFQGYQGIQGVSGSTGTQGSQGIAGAAANQGIQGAQGVVGGQGVQGTQGTQGSDATVQGIQGSQGIQGLTGAGTQGSQGIQGNGGATGGPGAQGIQGSDGTQGIQGIQGISGANGTNGSQGIQGITGSQGVQGIQGTNANVQGIQGSQGIQGLTGAGTQGSQGIQGNGGATGGPGAQGVQGIQGSDATVQGIQGRQGTQGVQGIQGTTGTSGSRSYTVTNNASNDYVIDGSNDPTLNLLRGFTYTFSVNASGHPFWIKTAQVTGTGSAYSSGVTNNGVDSGTITFAVPYDAPSTLYYICQFHSLMSGTISITDVGPQGIQGIQGIQGLTGTGTQGTQGTNGSQGIQGITGAGTQGTQGIQGPSGGGGGTGETYWAATGVGIHTLSNVGIATTNPVSTLQVGRYGVVTGFGTFNSTVGVAADLDTFTIATTDFKTAEYTLHVGYGTYIQSQKVLVMQNGTTAYSQEYAIMYDPSIVVSIGATVSAGVCKLQATPEAGVSGLTTYRFVRTTLL